MSRSTRAIAVSAIVIAIAHGVTLGLLEAARADPLPPPKRLEPMKAPAAAADLDLVALDGTRHALSAYRNNVVLINFWATWCEPCVVEMPAIERLKRALAGAPFVVLAVNYGESKARIGEFLARHPVAFPLLFDPDKKAGRGWNVRILPTSFIVGPDGRVRYTAVGEIDWDSPEIVNTLRQLLPR
jgi:cytochrome c biogenesis protein CcmG, thiol:disulfide interchange protein DsbE